MVMSKLVTSHSRDNQCLSTTVECLEGRPMKMLTGLRLQCIPGAQ